MPLRLVEKTHPDVVFVFVGRPLAETSEPSRLGEKTIQKIGLAAPSNDANTGDIVQPWNSFVHMREGLKDIQAQVGLRLPARLPACLQRGAMRCNAGGKCDSVLAP